MKVIQCNIPSLNFVIKKDIDILENIDLQSQEFYFDQNNLKNKN